MPRARLAVRLWPMVKRQAAQPIAIVYGAALKATSRANMLGRMFFSGSCAHIAIAYCVVLNGGQVSLF